MAKNNLNTRTILLAGSNKVFCELGETIHNEGYNLIYFRSPYDIFSFGGRIDLATFQDNNFDLISEFRRRNQNTPIILMDSNLRKSALEKYKMIKVDVLSDTSKLVPRIEHYLS